MPGCSEREREFVRVVVGRKQCPLDKLKPIQFSFGEGNAVTTAMFTVTLSQASSQTVTLQYATADGTAVAGSDYTAVSGTLTFAPGETVKNVAVPIADDAVDEPNEDFTLGLSSPPLCAGSSWDER